jgi:hypothetical protein
LWRLMWRLRGVVGLRLVESIQSSRRPITSYSNQCSVGMLTLLSFPKWFQFFFSLVHPVVGQSDLPSSLIHTILSNMEPCRYSSAFNVLTFPDFQHSLVIDTYSTDFKSTKPSNIELPWRTSKSKMHSCPVSLCPFIKRARNFPAQLRSKKGSW